MLKIIKVSLITAAAVAALPLLSAAQMMGGGYGYGPGMMGRYYDNNGQSLEQPKEIQADLVKIQKEQGLKEGEPVNPDKVSPKLLGELGDDVMDVVIGNKEQHEWMDNMMGGEGSVTLENMHEQMGYRYLIGQPIGMMGWGYGQGGARRGYYGMPGYGGMMGYYGGFYGNNPYMPMMSFGSFLGTGTLMDINWILDYRFADYLGLTKDQVKKITELKSSYEKETDPLRTQLLEKRRSLFDLWSAVKPDEGAIKNANKEIINLLSTVSDRETDYQVKVLGILTPEQRKKMDYRGVMNYQNRYLNRGWQEKSK